MLRWKQTNRIPNVYFQCARHSASSLPRTAHFAHTRDADASSWAGMNEKAIMVQSLGSCVTLTTSFQIGNLGEESPGASHPGLQGGP